MSKFPAVELLERLHGLNRVEHASFRPVPPLDMPMRRTLVLLHIDANEDVRLYVDRHSGTIYKIIGVDWYRKEGSYA